jgi:rhomboid family GlyGly-CTERM serine protease
MPGTVATARRPGGRPWATALITAAAVAMYLWPAGLGLLVFERDEVLRGEAWRLMTCHLVHFSPSHLMWNLAVLGPVGFWCERLRPAQTRWFYGAAAVMIALTLLTLQHGLERYGGLSGIATGLVVLLALIHGAASRAPSNRADRADRWIWRLLLAAVAVKIGIEASQPSPLFARFGEDNVRTVPLAHVAGAVTAVGTHAIAKLRL